MKNTFRMSAIVPLAMLLAAAAGSAGCREPKTPAELMGDLHSPDPGKRQSAADGLRGDTGVSPEAVGAILQALQTEQEPKVIGAEIITLGRSGVPEAKPIIDQHINTNDRDMRRWAARALKYWMIANHQLDKDAQLPEGWPYGQPGFPAILPKE